MKILYRILPCLLLVAVSFTGLAQNTVAFYPFTSTPNDLSIYDNHATINGALLEQNRFGWAKSAFYFDGERSFLAAQNASQLLTDNVTISLWVNVTEIPVQGEAYLLSFGGWQERWKISLPNHGKLIWTTNSESGISDMDAGEGNELEVGVWTHVVVTHDGAKDRIYLDGTMVAEKDVTGALNTTERPLGFGYDIVGGGSFFNGLLDDVIIFDDAMNDTQVAELFANQSEEPVIDEGLVAYYSFSETFKDSTDFANQAKGTNVKFEPDRFGYGQSAVSFDGTSSRIDIDNSAQLNSDFTSVAFWINVRELPPTGEVFVASFGGWQERWKISLPDHGKIVWTTNHENGISDMDIGEDNALETNTWMHLAFIHDGTKDKIYKNGALVAEKDVEGKLNTTTLPFGLGYSPIDNGLFFNGLLDEVRVYNYALTDQDVSDLYDAESTGSIAPDPLVANFPFAGDATDASQFGNDGIVVNAVPAKDRFNYGSNAYAFSEGAMIYAPNSERYKSDFTTVMFWVNVNALPPTGEVYLLSLGGWQERFKISLPEHGKPVWTTNHENGISDMDAGEDNALVPGAWTHLAFVHDGTQDKIYVNGAMVAEKDVSGALNVTDKPLGIGFDPIGGANFFDGSIDEVRIYNDVLTDQQIADLYDAQNTPPVNGEVLVADYPFAGNAFDATKYNNHGIVNGALLTTDRFGRANQAYMFDGASGAISAGNSEQLSSPAATVSMWVNVRSLPAPGNETYLISYGGWQERFKVSLPNHGKVVWTTNHINGISDMDAGEGNELVPGEWTHAVFVHDGTHDKIYINGAKVAEKEVVGDLSDTDQDLGIGYNIIDNANFFDGMLDDVQLYNVALTDQEIADLFAAQSMMPDEDDKEAPSLPLDLIGEVSFTNVDLQWCESTDNVSVTGYNVFVDTVKVMTTAVTHAALTGLAPLTEFTFGVTAVDAAGNESPMTTLQLTTGMDETPDTIPPTPPQNLGANTSANSIILTWDPATDNQALAGYIVFVDGMYFDSLNADATSVFVGGLEPETPYYFEVQAFDLAGNLSEFAELEATTAPPVVTDEDGLVAHYPFEGDANDATPYENHGTPGGDVAFVDGSIGMAALFDGDQDSILVPNAAHLISDYTSVSFWVRVDANTDDPEAYLLDFGHWSERWKISLPQHLKVVWTTNSKTTQFPSLVSDMDAGDGNELVIGFWFHVVMVHDGENDIIYLDGVEVNRKPAPGILNPTGRPFHMGSAFVGKFYFTGALDEVKVYNKALTPDEVDKLYNTGTTSIPYINAALSRYVDILYPNPATSEIVIEHGFNATQPLLVRVFDQSGRQVDALRYESIALRDGRLQWDVSDYSNGVYSLNFIFGNKNLGSIPFVKQ